MGKAVSFFQEGPITCASTQESAVPLDNHPIEHRVTNQMAIRRYSISTGVSAR